MSNQRNDPIKMLNVYRNTCEGDSFLDWCIEQLAQNNAKSISCYKSSDDNEGIYLFWVKLPTNKSLGERLELISQAWDQRKCNSQLGSHPRFSNKRRKNLENSSLKGDWIPLYLGISRELNKRLRLHINKPVEGTYLKTGALKINATLNYFKDWEFKVATILFNDLGNRYYLCEVLEILLRERINPITGD